MRQARIKADGQGYYHCMSRIIERRRILGKNEKDRLIKLMRDTAAFCGLDILSYAFLDNHFHLLIRVPPRREVSDQVFIQRLGRLYPSGEVNLIERKIKDLRSNKQDHAAEQIKSLYTYRMYDLSEFFKTFKQRFSQYYNTREDREGPLWIGRFRSILIEDSRDALLTIASYIELNPVRAGLVKDPKDYRYSSYGAAVGGDREARKGLRQLIRTAMGNKAGRLSWGAAQRIYRMRLYLEGEDRKFDQDGNPVRVGFSKERVEQVIAQGGKLPMQVALRCRVRYFSYGLALGCRGFVEKVFERYRGQFGPRRSTGACALAFAEWPPGLSTLRTPRMPPISLS